MKYNNGKSINLNNIKNFQAKKQQLAAEFGEGCEALEKLLLKLWDKNIETYSCCAGNLNMASFPCIAINFKNSRPKLSQVQDMLNYLKQNFNQHLIIDYTNNCLSLSFFSKTFDEKLLVSRDKFFNLLLTATESLDGSFDCLDKKQYKNQMFEFIKKLMGFKFIYDFSFKNNKFYIYENGVRKSIMGATEAKAKFPEISEMLDRLISGEMPGCTLKM